MRLLLLLLILPQLAAAATITGTVYDIGLERVENAIVSIDTTPGQRFVVQNGTYAFTLSDGTYTLRASATIENATWSTSQQITADGEGTYTLDLLLEPDFSDAEALSFEEVLPDEDERTPPPLLPLLVAALALVGIGLFYGRMMSQKAPKNIVEDDEYRREVLRILRRHKGRVTQRDLRREVPFSEAKVSLVLTELEAEGRIRKIRKGRGNVIVRT